MKNRIKIITAFSVGFILALGIGVYAAVTYNSKDIVYKNKTVEKALDDLYEEKNSQLGSYICKRATDLHTETCEQTGSNGCAGAGYTASGSKGISTITYGNLGTPGTLTSGDAFDCDVDGTGYNHRFYFVSYKYIGGTTGYEAYDTNVAALIYYNNVSDGIANNKLTYSYNSGDKNYEGPVIAVSQLPTTSQWSKLKSTKRVILNESGGNTSNNGLNTLPGNVKASFDYSNYAARLMTYQELVAGCGNGTPTSTGYLNDYTYLMENTKFSSSSIETYGYWLETPRAKNKKSLWFVAGLNRTVDTYSSNGYDSGTTSYLGVRPVIDVPISDIEI